MGQAIGDVLPLAVGVAISPVPIIAIVVMLGTPRARSDGPAFAVGWVAGLAVVGTIVLLAVGGSATTSEGKPATWESLLKLLIGLLFLLIAAKQWRGRPRAGVEPPMPKWMKAVDTFTAPKALGMGFVLAALNPKNLALAAAAAAAIAEANIPGGQEAGVLAIFIAIGSVTILGPVVMYFAMGPRAQELLAGVKGWMTANSPVIMAVLMLVLGAKLIGDAIAGFTG